jgi:hypothetical protein
MTGLEAGFIRRSTVARLLQLRALSANQRDGYLQS